VSLFLLHRHWLRNQCHTHTLHYIGYVTGVHPPSISLPPPPSSSTTSTIFLPYHNPCVFLHSQTHTTHQHRCIHSCKMQSHDTTTPMLQFTHTHTHTPVLFLRWNKTTSHLWTNERPGWECPTPKHPRIFTTTHSHNNPF